MANKVGLLTAVAIVLVLILATPANGGSLKGRWEIQIFPDDHDSLTTTFSFRKGGKGTAGNVASGGGVSYRESGTEFSATWELDGPIIPVGFVDGPSTIVLRGIKTSENTVAGQVVIISDHPDSGSVTQFETVIGTFEGTRLP